MNDERTLSVRIDYYPDREQGPQFGVQAIRDDGFGNVIHDEMTAADFESKTSAFAYAGDILGLIINRTP